MNLRKWMTAAVAFSALACLTSQAQAAITAPYAGLGSFLSTYSNTFTKTVTNNGNQLRLQTSDAPNNPIAGGWDQTWGSGGEFRVYSGGVTNGFVYNDAVNQNRLFKTFCIEKNEFFSPGASYYATIDKDALFGANGGQATNPLLYNNNSYDVLSDATKWLYGKYFDGTLGGMDFNGALAGGVFSFNDETSASELQEAIWKLEDLSGANGLALDMLTYAQNATDGTGVDDTYYDNRVAALNLWTGYNASATWQYSGAVQSQVVYVGNDFEENDIPNVPEPATLAIWGMGLGIAGLVKLRRKKEVA